MKQILFIFALLFVSACFWKTPKKAATKIPNVCDSLQQFVLENWRYSEKSKIYKASPEFLAQCAKPQGKFYHCFVNLSMDSVEKILGKPHMYNKLYTNARYHLHEGCNGGSYCSMIDITYSSSKVWLSMQESNCNIRP